MVLPEGTGSPRTRPRGGRYGVILLAASAVLVGGLALGSLTSPSTIGLTGVSSTTTTTTPRIDRPIDPDNLTVDQIAVGEPLRWALATSFNRPGSHALVEHNGIAYAFGFGGWLEAPGTGGLSVWRSPDGLRWESLGVAIGEDHHIVGVESTRQGLIALETGQSDMPPQIWTSDDAVVWANHVVPTDDEDSLIVSWPVSVGADEQRIVVAVRRLIDIADLLHDRGLGSLDEYISLGYRIEPLEDDIRLTIYGPLGLVLLDTTGDELGLDDDQRRLLRDSSGLVPEIDMFTFSETDDWVRGEERDQWLDSITPSPDGGFVAIARFPIGPHGYRSEDGLYWQVMDMGVRPTQIVTWGDRLVGALDAQWPEILVSSDGETWDRSGLADRFVPTRVTWSITALGAGPGGIASTIASWTDRFPRTDTTDPPTLDVDGRVITVHVENLSLSMEVGDEIQVWGFQSDEMTIDLVEKTVILLDHETDQPLVTIDLDDLERVERGYWTRAQAINRLTAFVYSPDALHWTIQDMGPMIDPNRTVTHLVVLDDRVIALAEGSDPRFSTVGAEIWSAQIP